MSLPRVFSVDVDTPPFAFKDLFRIQVSEILDEGGTRAYIYYYIIRLFSSLASRGTRGESPRINASRCTLCTEIVVKLKSNVGAHHVRANCQRRNSRSLGAQPESPVQKLQLSYIVSFFEICDTTAENGVVAFDHIFVIQLEV